jgi:hypothetical protein
MKVEKAKTKIFFPSKQSCIQYSSSSIEQMINSAKKEFKY